jgi:hypothetical protein
MRCVPSNRSVQGTEPFLSVIIAALTNDDGVVHDYAEDEDEAHERGKIDRDVHVGHQGEGTEKAHHHPDADPDHGLESEEQTDANKDEEETAFCILDEEIDPAFYNLRTVVQIVELHAAGKDAVGRGDIGFDPFPDGDRILIALPHYGDHDAGPTVEFYDEGIFGKAIEDFCDLSEGEFAAVGAGQDRDSGVVFASVGPTASADRDISSLSLNHACGEVDRAGLDRAADRFEAEVVFPKGRFGDFDRDLLFPDSCDFCVRDAGEDGKFVAGLLGESLQIALCHVRAQDHGDDRVKGVVELDDGFFRESWKIGDGIEADFYILEDETWIIALVHFNGDGPAIASGRGINVFDAPDLLDGLFDLQHDRLLRFLRR